MVSAFVFMMKCNVVAPVIASQPLPKDSYPNAKGGHGKHEKCCTQARQKGKLDGPLIESETDHDGGEDEE